MTTDRALMIVRDPKSPSEDFGTAIKYLNSTAGDASFWLHLAADAQYSPDRRRHFVKHFFDHFVSAGMRLDGVTKLIGENVNWISYDRIKRREYDRLLGWVPDALLKGKSAFSIPILSEGGGDYHLVIFISFQEDLKLKDLLNELKLGEKASAAGKTIIAACESWDSYDEWRQFHTNQSPWPWDS